MVNIENRKRNLNIKLNEPDHDLDYMLRKLVEDVCLEYWNVGFIFNSKDYDLFIPN